MIAGEASVKNKRTVALFVIVVFMLLLFQVILWSGFIGRASSEDISPSYWPMEGGDPQHTGRSNCTVADNKGEVKWNNWVGGVFKIAIGSDSTIYLASISEGFLALDETGSVIWSYALPFSAGSPAIGQDGTIYFTTGTTYIRFSEAQRALYSLSPSGGLKWSYSLDGGGLLSSPIVERDGTILIGMAIDDLYGTGGENGVVAVNPNGSLKWKFNSDGGVMSAPAVGLDGNIYFGCMDGNLYSLDPSGSLRWRYNSTGSIYASPTIADPHISFNGISGVIYFGTLDGQGFYTVSPNGTLLGRLGNFTGMLFGASLGPNGMVYAPFGRDLYAFDVSGVVRWIYETPSETIWSSPVVSADGIIVFSSGSYGTIDYRVTALNPDGSLRWECPVGDCWTSSPVIGPDGTVYIGVVNDGRLYAINTRIHGELVVLVPLALVGLTAFMYIIPWVFRRNLRIRQK